MLAPATARPRALPALQVLAKMSPREILAELKDGNTRFWTGAPENREMPLAERKETLAGQAPKVMIIGCADSRVPVGARRAHLARRGVRAAGVASGAPQLRRAAACARCSRVACLPARASPPPPLACPSSAGPCADAPPLHSRPVPTAAALPPSRDGCVHAPSGSRASRRPSRALRLTSTPLSLSASAVFDKGIGELFVCRNAGNLYGDNIAGTIDYAVHVLGVKVVVVKGHEGCGAVKAALAKPPGLPPKLSKMLDSIHDGLEYCVDVLERIEDSSARDRESVIANALVQVRRVLAEPGVAAKVEKKELLVLAAFYNISSGIVDFIEPTATK